MTRRQRTTPTTRYRVYQEQGRFFPGDTFQQTAHGTPTIPRSYAAGFTAEDPCQDVCAKLNRQFDGDVCEE